MKNSGENFKVCFIKEWRKVSERKLSKLLKSRAILNINSKIWNGILKWIVFKEIKKLRYTAFQILH